MRHGWRRVFDRSYGRGAQGRDVYVRQEFYPLFNQLEKQKLGNYQYMSLFRSLVGLNADPNSGVAANAAANLRNLICNGFAVEYYLDNGDVLISKIKLSAGFSSRNFADSSGLFSVRRNNGVWECGARPSEGLNYKEKWDGAHYAAVSGRFSDPGAASRRLVDHIKKAYKSEVLEKNVEVNGNRYSLYWTYGRAFGGVSETNAIASLLQQAADAKASVNWLVHGEGAQNFSKALELLKNSPSLSRYAAADEEIVRGLRMKFSEQKVYLSNPVGADKKTIEPLCKMVGLTWVDQNLNSRDLRSSASRRNVYKEIASLSGKAVVGGGAAGVGLKELGVSSLQKAGAAAVDICSSAVANPTVQSVALAAGAAYGVFVAGKGVYTKSSSAYKAAKAMMISTFGAGSEFWYENDDDLFEQMSA